MPNKILFTAVMLAALHAHAEPAVTAADLEARIRSTPLTGQSESFMSAGSAFGVDPRLLVAISGAESSYGKAICAPNNAWNWFYNGACPPTPGKSSFDSWYAGMQRVSNGLQRIYISHGYKTIEQIAGKYCATGCGNWIPNVRSIYGALDGDPSDLTYHHALDGAQAATHETNTTLAPQSVPHTTSNNKRAKRHAGAVSKQPPEPETSLGETNSLSKEPLFIYTFPVLGALLLLAGGSAAFFWRRKVVQKTDVTPRLSVSPSLLHINLPSTVTLKLASSLRPSEHADIDVMLVDQQGAAPAIVGSMLPSASGYEMTVTLTPDHLGNISFQALIRLQKGSEMRTIASRVCTIPVLAEDIRFDVLAR